MAEIDDGGPAFPNAWNETNENGVSFPYVEHGLSMRDYFASKAMQALLASANTKRMMEILTANAVLAGYKGREDEFLASRAYDMADAMISERKSSRK